MQAETILFRPKWTCGRFHKESETAIMYNLSTGLSYLFENESSTVISVILDYKRGSSFKVEDLCSRSHYELSDLEGFIEVLIDNGLLSLIETIEDPFHSNELANQINKPLVNDSQSIINETEIVFAKRTNNRVADVVLELTYNCSEKCIHCYNPGATRNNDEISFRSNFGTLSFGDYKRIIDELNDLGVVKVCLTGGDPFSNKDIWGIVSYLYEKEIAFEIFTNGLGLLGKEQRLASLFPLDIGLTIYSTNPDVHDRITRVPGSLKKTLEVLANLHKIGVPLIIKCPLMRLNFKDYPKVIALGETYNAEVQIDGRLLDSSDGDECVSNYLRLSEEQLKVVLMDNRVQFHVGKDLEEFGALNRNQKDVACLAGMNNICITPDGNVIPCVCFHSPIGNVQSHSLKEILTNNPMLKKLSEMTYEKYPFCGKEEYCKYCMLCPGLNFSKHGKIEVPAEDNCYFAKIRHQLVKEIREGKDPLKGITIEEALSHLEEDIPNQIHRIINHCYYNHSLIS